MTENEGLWPLCETCGAVPTRHNDYKDCEKHLQVVARAYEAGRTNGIKDEHASVVVYLHAEAKRMYEAGQDRPAWFVLENRAEAIENGEHRPFRRGQMTDAELAGARLAALLDAERENTVLRGELLEHARLAGMGSEREARLMAQVEEARKELQRVTESVMEALPVTTVAFTGDYGLYVRACVDALLEQEREQVVRFLRQSPEKAKACDKPHRHEDGKPCVVLVPVDLDEAADLIEQGKHVLAMNTKEN